MIGISLNGSLKLGLLRGIKTNQDSKWDKVHMIQCTSIYDVGYI